MTIEIKPPMNPDGAEAVLGFMVSEAEKATQLPAISGIILRDEPTEEVVGPGEWMPMLTRNDDAIGLVIPDVGIVATVMPNGRYSLGSTKNGDEATVQNAKDTIEQGFVVCGNK